MYKRYLDGNGFVSHDTAAAAADMAPPAETLHTRLHACSHYAGRQQLISHAKQLYMHSTQTREQTKNAQKIEPAENRSGIGARAYENIYTADQ